MATESDETQADFNTFQGVIDWFESHALKRIVDEYDPSFETFGLAFVSLEDGKPLPGGVEPVPVLADADIGDPDFQEDYADQLRCLLKETAATGVAIVANVQDDPDGVIVCLEHKGGHAAWMATVGEDGALGKFERDDQIHWQPDHVFSNLLPPRHLN